MKRFHHSALVSSANCRTCHTVVNARQSFARHLGAVLRLAEHRLAVAFVLALDATEGVQHPSPATRLTQSDQGVHSLFTHLAYPALVGARGGDLVLLAFVAWGMIPGTGYSVLFLPCLHAAACRRCQSTVSGQ